MKGSSVFGGINIKETPLMFPILQFVSFAPLCQHCACDAIVCLGFNEIVYIKTIGTRSATLYLRCNSLGFNEKVHITIFEALSSALQGQHNQNAIVWSTNKSKQPSLTNLFYFSVYKYCCTLQPYSLHRNGRTSAIELSSLNQFLLLLHVNYTAAMQCWKQSTIQQ